jgi:hypothetical protein
MGAAATNSTKSINPSMYTIILTYHLQPSVLAISKLASEFNNVKVMS